MLFGSNFATVILLVIRNFQNVAAKCPFVNELGPTLKEANELAVSRLADFEDTFPARLTGRIYSPGVENPSEIYCDGADENKFCNKVG